MKDQSYRGTKKDGTVILHLCFRPILLPWGWLFCSVLSRVRLLLPMVICCFLSYTVCVSSGWSLWELRLWRFWWILPILCWWLLGQLESTMLSIARIRLDMRYAAETFDVLYLSSPPKNCQITIKTQSFPLVLLLGGHNLDRATPPTASINSIIQRTKQIILIPPLLFANNLQFTVALSGVFGVCVGCEGCCVWAWDWERGWIGVGGLVEGLGYGESGEVC